MKAADADKLLALSTAFKALVVSLAETGRLDVSQFEDQMHRGVEWLERAGEDVAASELRGEFSGMWDVLCEVSQRD